MQTLLNELRAHQDNRNDKRKFGLVLQGGGMRASYSAAAAAVLVKHRISNSFDHVIGSSAGAINGAYMLAADAETLNHTYIDDLTNKNFVNFLRKEKKIDIDYLVDMVMYHKRSLSFERLSKSPSKLHVIVTDAKSGRKLDITDHRTLQAMYEELRATAALPILYDKQIKIGDHFYIDGGVADLLPIDIAIKQGCTDIVVILTQQLAFYRFDKRHTRLVRRLIRKLAKDQTKALRKVLPTNEHLLKANLRLITKPHKKVRFYVLEPSNEEILVSLSSTDKNKIEQLVRLGATDMESFISEPISHS